MAGGRALGEERAARRHMGGPGQGRQRTRGDTCCADLDSRSASDAEGPCPGKQHCTARRFVREDGVGVEGG